MPSDDAPSLLEAISAYAFIAQQSMTDEDIQKWLRNNIVLALLGEDPEIARESGFVRHAVFSINGQLSNASLKAIGRRGSVLAPLIEIPAHALVKAKIQWLDNRITLESGETFFDVRVVQTAAVKAPTKKRGPDNAVFREVAQSMLRSDPEELRWMKEEVMVETFELRPDTCSALKRDNPNPSRETCRNARNAILNEEVLGRRPKTVEEALLVVEKLKLYRAYEA